MLILRSAFPYGVNNKIGEEHQRDSDTPIRISFPYLHKNILIIQIIAFLIYMKKN